MWRWLQALHQGTAHVWYQGDEQGSGALSLLFHVHRNRNWPPLHHPFSTQGTCQKQCGEGREVGEDWGWGNGGVEREGKEWGTTELGMIGGDGEWKKKGRWTWEVNEENRLSVLYPCSCTLKPYQVLGFSWLTLLHSMNVNGILADEMVSLLYGLPYCSVFDCVRNGIAIVDQATSATAT